MRNYNFFAEDWGSLVLVELSELLLLRSRKDLSVRDLFEDLNIVLVNNIKA